MLPSLQPCPQLGSPVCRSKNQKVCLCLSKHLLSIFYISVPQANDTEFKRQIPCLQVVCSPLGVIDKGTNDPNTMWQGLGIHSSNIYSARILDLA